MFKIYCTQTSAYNFKFSTRIMKEEMHLKVSYYPINITFFLFIFSNGTMYVLKCFIFQNDVEIPIPKYFIYERHEALQKREKTLGQILAKMGPQDKDDVRFLSIYYIK